MTLRVCSLSWLLVDYARVNPASQTNLGPKTLNVALGDPSLHLNCEGVISETQAGAPPS